MWFSCDVEPGSQFNDTSTTDVTICPNQLPYNWNGTDYRIAGLTHSLQPILQDVIQLRRWTWQSIQRPRRQLMLRFVLTNYLITGMASTILQEELIHSRQSIRQDVIQLRRWTWQSIQRPRQQLMLRFVLTNYLITGMKHWLYCSRNLYIHYD
jgi:hypothetical protein